MSKPRKPRVFIGLFEIAGYYANLQRGLEDPKREFYHGDKRVAEYRKTGVVPPVESYAAPQLDAPTLHVSTDGEYVPSIDEIVAQAEAIQYRPRRLE